MQFSHTNRAGGGRFGKFALVAGLHALLAALFIHGLDTQRISLPGLPDDLTVLLHPEPVPPAPPPPNPPQALPQVAPPKLFVPKIDVDVAPPPDPAPLQATTAVPDPAPAPAAHPVPDAPPATKPAATGGIRSAVFADANGCALPAYPTRALRNEESGTTTLALLVGVDGRVTSARVERSSGSRELDQAALHALSLCTFKPAMNNGVAEAGWARLAYVWTLE
ncbi:energy transducer TonB [uncultured Massilia sp.]|uniref:energy transducer TonB n=1 Tax=uncultured Massilia sp. TaxID=169973 RepID=UPI0025E658B7|nr:energy transducer TonB [uncultured Massilia sp.]